MALALAPIQTTIVPNKMTTIGAPTCEVVLEVIQAEVAGIKEDGSPLPIKKTLAYNHPMAIADHEEGIQRMVPAKNTIDVNIAKKQTLRRHESSSLSSSLLPSVSNHDKAVSTNRMRTRPSGRSMPRMKMREQTKWSSPTRILTMVGVTPWCCCCGCGCGRRRVVDDKDEPVNEAGRES